MSLCLNLKYFLGEALRLFGYVCCSQGISYNSVHCLVRQAYLPLTALTSSFFTIVRTLFLSPNGLFPKTLRRAWIIKPMSPLPPDLHFIRLFYDTCPVRLLLSFQKLSGVFSLHSSVYLCRTT